MSQWKVGVVTSRFNEEVTYKLEEGALAYLESCGVDIMAVRVPGAVEIPLACKTLLDLGCDGVVACGAVIRGETSHYDFVCNSVERGITQLMLETGKPIGFGVLTTEDDEQALARAGGAHGNKGTEAAQVTIEMIGLTQDLRQAVRSSKGQSSKKTAKKSAVKVESKSNRSSSRKVRRRR